jgi:MoaA/NifB/PqqE/SkfB family radical SAM enzyme
MPNIPVVFPGKFPKSFKNIIRGWGCPEDEELLRAKAAFEAENPGKPFIYMADMYFGRKCWNNCPNCFTECQEYAGDPAEDLSFDEKLSLLIKPQLPYGLHDVKVLGLGDPLDEPTFIPFIKILREMGLDVCFFTKTSVLANDERCLSTHGCTSWELAQTLAELEVTVLVGFNAIDWSEQERQVVSPKGNYAAVRNRTLEILAEAGLNKSNPSRLGLGSSPLTVSNARDMIHINEWARTRNLYIIICPAMCVGNCKKEVVWRPITPSLDEQIRVYTEISRFNIERGIWTLDELIEKGMPPYAGMIRCTQVNCGVLWNLQGKATYCPGSDVILGDIRKDSIETILSHSPHFGKVRDKSIPCQAKYGLSMPVKLQEQVLAELLNNYAGS